MVNKQLDDHIRKTYFRTPVKKQLDTHIRQIYFELLRNTADELATCDELAENTTTFG